MPFFPLYPALIHALAWITRSDLVAGVLISLVAFAVALVLLHRLVLLDFGEDVAEATVMLIAFCPVAFFFSAVYTESLFLALSVGAIYAARRERWLRRAGLLGGFLQQRTRATAGVALILPVAVIYLYGPRAAGTAGTARRTRWGLRPGAVSPACGRCCRATGCALERIPGLLPIPAGLAAYLGYLWISYGDPLAPFRAESIWYRHSTFPYTTIWHAARQAWEGVVQLFQGPNGPGHVPDYTQSVISAALQDVYLFLFLVLGVIGLFGVFWSLGASYGFYTLVMLVLALSDPVSLQPLASLPRYELIIFPLFIWGARLLTRWRLVPYAIPALAVLLGLFTVEFATWHWVA